MRLGIDLGGTKIEALVLDGAGRELFRRRVATPQGDYQGTLQTIADLVRAAREAVGPLRVGIGTPGSPSRLTGLIRNANSTVLNGRPLHQDLEALLGGPVQLANDADCFTLSEGTDGAGAGARSVFGVILGTGVGGGLLVNGALLDGPNGIAGEWGHNPLPWPEPEELPGPACYCGRRGCIETWLSGPGMSADHLVRTGEGRTAQDIVVAAERGDPGAKATLERYVDRLARSLASVINIVDPEVIVLGGGLSNIDALYHQVPHRWRRYVFSDHVTTRLCSARYGDASGVRGAAWL